MTASVLRHKLDVVLRAPGMGRHLGDLLHLLVAHCEDNDVFKAKTAARMGCLEDQAVATEEAAREAQVIAGARGMDEAMGAVCAELETVQRQAAALEGVFRERCDDLAAEVQRKTAGVVELAAAAEAQQAQLASASRSAFVELCEGLDAKAEAALQGSLAKAVSELEAAATGQRRELTLALDAAGDRAQQRLLSECTTAASTAADAVSTECRDARRDVQQHVHQAAHALREAADRQADFLAATTETLNALPLLECHRLQCAVAVCEARCEGTHGLVSRAESAQSDIARVQHTSDCLAAEVASLREAVAALEGRGRILSPAAGPRSPDSAFGPVQASQWSFPADDEPEREPSVVAATDIDDGSPPLLAAAVSDAGGSERPVPLRMRSSLSKRQSSVSPSFRMPPALEERDPRPQPPRGPTDGQDASRGELLAGLRAGRQRSEALEAAIAGLKHDSAVTWQALKKVTAFVETDVTGRVDDASRLLHATLHVLRLDPATARQLFNAHHGVVPSGASGSPLRARLGEEAVLRQDMACAAVVSRLPAVMALAPLPPLGVALADSPAPVLGVRVVSVVPGGIAAAAGLEPGDVVTRVEDRPVGTRRELSYALMTAPSRTSHLGARDPRAGPTEAAFVAPDPATAHPRPRLTVYKIAAAQQIAVELPIDGW